MKAVCVITIRKNKEIDQHYAESYLINHNKSPLVNQMYLIFEQIIPALSTQSISNDKLENVEWDVENDTVKPNNSSPSPSNAVDPCKPPVCVDGNHCSHLNSQIP